MRLQMYNTNMIILELWLVPVFVHYCVVCPQAQNANHTLRLFDVSIMDLVVYYYRSDIMIPFYSSVCIL